VTRTWPVAGVLFGILWVFVQGPPLAPEPLVGSLLIGLAVGFPTAFVFRRLYEDNMEPVDRFAGSRTCCCTC